jgi:hypothetical protein
MVTRKSKRKMLEDDLREKTTLISEGCRLRGLNTIDFVAQCVEAHRKGLAPPSLLPDDPIERARFLDDMRKLGFIEEDKKQ